LADDHWNNLLVQFEFYALGSVEEAKKTIELACFYLPQVGETRLDGPPAPPATTNRHTPEATLSIEGSKPTQSVPLRQYPCFPAQNLPASTGGEGLGEHATTERDTGPSLSSSIIPIDPMRISLDRPSSA
jgi:hypothetical protein